MLTRLTIINFMAHGHTVLEFGTGVTVLSGPNNTGKSAVVEALRCLTTSPPAKHFIRHGEKEARIEAEFDDGVRVAWIRRKAYALYEVHEPGREEPETYAKYGNSPPEDVLDILRFHRVELEMGEPVDVHLGNQREPVFLFDKPGAVASFFAASSEGAHLLAMQKALKKRVRDQKTLQKNQLNRLARTRTALNILEPLPSLSLQTEQARNLYDRIMATRTELPVLAGRADSIRGAQKRIEVENSRANVLAKLVDPPQLWPTAPLARHLEQRRMVAQKASHCAQTASALSPLKQPPALFDCAALRERLQNLSREKSRLTAAGRRSDILAKLRSVPELFPAGALAEYIKRMTNGRQMIAEQEQRAAVLADLAEVPVLQDLSPLQTTLQNITAMQKEVETAQKTVLKAEQALQAHAAIVRDALEKRGDCPLCGQQMDMETFLGVQDGPAKEEADA